MTCPTAALDLWYTLSCPHTEVNTPVVHPVVQVGTGAVQSVQAVRARCPHGIVR